ncbi:MAG TPA: YihY/virulence factor BrkB family protein [Candidatus Methylomirabilis sp.]|nr:YihY/virulence factor BrkB family protein [Candidatus Methylomirabilis sp.]
MARLREVLRVYWAVHPMEQAAALSYYTLLSLAPLILLAVALAGLVFERPAVEGRIVAEVRTFVGHDGAEAVELILRHANDPSKGARSVVISMILLAVGATTVFAQLQESLNRIWSVEANPRRSVVWGFVKERLLSLAMVAGIGFLLLVSLLVNAVLSAAGERAHAAVGAPHGLQASNLLISVIVGALLFAAMFKVLPDAPVAWGDVWFGAMVTSVLFTLGKHLIGVYLGRTGIGSAYGAAGSVVVLTVWVYYASLIVLFGAVLTRLRSLHWRGGGGPAIGPGHEEDTGHPAGQGSSSRSTR